MRRHTAFTMSFVALAVAVATACGIEGRADAGPAAQAPTAKESGKQLWHESSGQPVANVSVPSHSSLAPLVKQLKPAVVNISSTTVMKNPHKGLRMPQGGGDDDENQQLFERFFGQREMPEELKGTSLGSGFIINEDGFVLTNNHVVKDATDIKVRLSDGREFEAKIVGRDPASDVALIKLQQLKGKLPTVALGDSDALDQGDFVVAIGSPLGFRESVTFGIISAKDRTLNSGPFDDFLQTDAAINQGNSGGPLFNMKGEVVGINTAIISPQIGSGIGFAVPINIAKQLIPQLLAGKVSRGYLGVAVSDLTPDFIQGFGLKEGTKGALVQSVVPKAPADKAGVKPGDVVVAVNGKAVDNPGLLTRTVSAIPPGGKATLTVLRGNEKKDLQVTVAQRPDEEALARGELGGEEGEGGEGAQKPGANDKLGIRIAPIPPKAASELGVQPDQGVLVVSVNPNGPAGTAGIRRNDVILEVNRQPVNKVEQVVGLIQQMKPGQVIVLRVQRGSQATYLPVKIGGEKEKK
ncbi:MAG TPA: trypsin-like peptidase domain-containing protein [Anaeromyxobacteraceae bacterium]|nr:trypsin-like peptidase domain-containing protein [Anaeromyxobacteraceae bacterium]